MRLIACVLLSAGLLIAMAGLSQAQAVLSQASFYSVNDFRLHFGLGAERTAALEIRWPNGGTERIAKVDADQLVTVKEGTGIVKAQRFER